MFFHVLFFINIIIIILFYFFNNIILQIPSLPGTLTSAIAHIITAVIGSGVLSLAWSTSQLGWIAGPVALLLFAIVTYISSFLVSDCYRISDSESGKRNYSYTEAVRVYLGTIILPHQLNPPFFCLSLV